MSDSPDDLRQCPTRIDHAPVLFAHKLTEGQCQHRQRGHYHKCFACAWNVLHLAAHGPPKRADSPREIKRIVRAG